MLVDFSTKYTYKDVTIQPAPISTIKHREECNVKLADGTLPIFAAPMSCLINEDNVHVFEKNGINVILPRNINSVKRCERARSGKWAAFSLTEFEELFTTNQNPFKPKPTQPIKVLIDVANGHMSHIYDLTARSKAIYGDGIQIMVGNIANAETYRYAAMHGVDYIRCSIGNGEGCLTSTHTAINYPIVSLLTDIENMKKRMLDEDGPQVYFPKVIADGGIRGFADIIKALALGADYVMIGGMLTSCLESASKTCFSNGHILSEEELGDLVFDGASFRIQDSVVDVFKQFYGMASSLGQKDLHNPHRPVEGCIKSLQVTNTLNSWRDKFISYLQSSMSYTNTKNIEEFKHNANVVVVSKASFEAINK